MKRSFSDLDSDEEIVVDKQEVHYSKNINQGISIKGRAKREADSKHTEKSNIKKIIKNYYIDKSKIKHLEERQDKSLKIILPYLRKQLVEIYRLDNEPNTFNHLKNNYL